MQTPSIFYIPYATCNIKFIKIYLNRFSPVGNNVPAVVAVDPIEKIARETICCWSCSISLYDRTDTLLWESMEFCSEKCLSK
jgi:hypothetical protein